MKKLLFSVFFFAFIYMINGQQVNPLLVADDIENQQKWVDSVYASMTLEEKFGQLFMVDLFSSDPKAKIDRIEKLITDYHIGGIIFSKGGPQRQAKITNCS